MDFSIWPAPGRSWDDIAATARLADDSGWHGIWFADHYMPNTEDGAIADGDTHECWAILPALAAITERVRLGSLVSPTTVHHPALLANRIATIDHISNGRAVLGLGAGWQVNEHRAYGIELRRRANASAVRRGDPDRAVAARPSNEPRSTGAYYTITDAPCDRSPSRRRLPILVGTSGPRDDAHHRPPRRRVEHVGRRRRGDDADVSVPRRVRRRRPRPGHDAPFGAGDRVDRNDDAEKLAKLRENASRRAFDRRDRRSWSTRSAATSNSDSTSSSCPNGTSGATSTNASPRSIVRTEVASQLT